MYGRHVHQAVIDAGDTVTGATVHYGTAEYDQGQIIKQGTVKVLAGDTAESLAERVLAVEHDLYWCAIDLVVKGSRPTHPG